MNKVWNIKLVISWLKVVLNNFPFYRFGRVKLSKYIVFKKTGHCLHFNNPQGRSFTNANRI